VLDPVKTQLLDEASKYIPGLKNIDLEKASLSDLQNAFKQSVLTKMKQNLPAEIADKLPENFTRDDILNSLKDIGSDQALAFAKKNLPNEAYQQLVANKDLIRDPTKIGDFVRGKLADVEKGFETKMGQAKQFAQTKLKETTDQLSGQFDEHIAPFKKTIDDLKTTRDTLSSKFQNTTQELNSRLDDAVQAVQDFKVNNPGYSSDDIEPLTRAVKNIKDEAKGARTAFETQDGDLADQLTQAQTALESKTSEVLNTLSNIKSKATGAANDVINTTTSKLNTAIDDGKGFVNKTGAKIEQTSEELAQTTDKAIEEGVGFFEKLKTGASNIATSIRKKASSFINPTTPEPSIAEGGHGYSMIEPDQLESGFSEKVMSSPSIGKSKLLTDYYASERDDPRMLLKSDSPVPKLPAAQPAAQKPKSKLRSSEPEFTDQEAAQKQLASGATDRPIEVLPKRPTGLPEVGGKPKKIKKAPKEEEKSIFDDDYVLPEAPVAQPQAPSATMASEQRTEELAAQQSEAPKAPAAEQPAAPETAPETAPKPTTTEPATPDLPEFEGLSPPPPATASGQTAVAQVGQQLEKKAVGTAEKVAGEGVEAGLDAAAIGTEEIPVLDVIMDAAGLIGSIFGGGELMNDKAPPPPIATGSSFEPGL
jgi:ABC-type transporter Mla subunit MlaD